MTDWPADRVAADENPEANALLTHKAVVDATWIDYNGHLTEWMYYKLFADAGENFLRVMGFTEDYRLKGYSFFSVEGHQRNLRECVVGTNLSFYTAFAGFDPIRLHIYQYALDTDRDIVLATGEHMMLHVDTRLRKARPAHQYMLDCLQRAQDQWTPALRPKGLSQSIQVIPRPAM